jgi:hypothetical protein
MTTSDKPSCAGDICQRKKSKSMSRAFICRDFDCKIREKWSSEAGED